jgi:hypothetical protein
MAVKMIFLQRGETGEEFGTKRGPEFLEKEKKACYGMVQELACADKVCFGYIPCHSEHFLVPYRFNRRGL